MRHIEEFPFPLGTPIGATKTIHYDLVDFANPLYAAEPHAASQLGSTWINTGVTYSDNTTERDIDTAVLFGDMIQRARMYRLKYQQKHKLGVWSD